MNFEIYDVRTRIVEFRNGIGIFAAFCFIGYRIMSAIRGGYKNRMIFTVVHNRLVVKGYVEIDVDQSYAERIIYIVAIRVGNGKTAQVEVTYIIVRAFCIDVQRYDAVDLVATLQARYFKFVCGCAEFSVF